MKTWEGEKNADEKWKLHENKNALQQIPDRIFTYINYCSCSEVNETTPADFTTGSSSLF